MSIQERAMLVQLNIKQWPGKKQDKKVTAEVETAHGAHNAGRFNKDLVSKSLLTPHTKLTGEVRQKHYELTLAWNDNGQRLLPSKLFMDYTAYMRTAKSAFAKLTSELVASYPAEVQCARQRLGTMYEPDDYPDASDMYARFDLAVEFAPVPAANDFRVDVGNEAAEEIRTSITNTVHTKQEAAVKATFARVRDVVSKIYERLSIPDAIFKDTLITNAEDLCVVLNGLNITDDPLITQLEKDIRGQLIEPPDAIRRNPALRGRVAHAAQEILGRIPS
jgi:hypothetical protein